LIDPERGHPARGRFGFWFPRVSAKRTQTKGLPTEGETIL